MLWLERGIRLDNIKKIIKKKKKTLEYPNILLKYSGVSLKINI